MTTPRPGETIPPRHSPPLPGPVLLAQTWRDIVFIHWPLAVAAVRELFPDGIQPDTLEGRTYVGIVGFSIPSTRVGSVLPIGSACELNVRLYSVDDEGRQGVLFLSMDVNRPDMVLAAHALLRLPYAWSHVEPMRPNPAAAGYRVRRRMASGPAAQVEIDVEAPVDQPSALEIFLTARWGLHARTTVGTTWIPVAHPPFRLHRGRLRHTDDALLTAAGVPPPSDPAVSVVWSPGLDAQIGRPSRVRPPKRG